MITQNKKQTTQTYQILQKKAIKVVGTLMLTATLFANTNFALADNQKQYFPTSESISAGIVSKNMLISGKPQTENPTALTFGKINFGEASIFGGASEDKVELRELDLGTAYQRKPSENKLGKITGKISLERKVFPDIGKEMDLADITISENTRLGDVSVLYRERFENQDYDSGRTTVLIATTPTLNLCKIARMTAGIKGTTALAYQDKFIGTSSEFAYVTPGLNLCLKKGNTSIEAFIKNQRAIRKDLDDHVYGGIVITYLFGSKN